MIQPAYPPEEQSRIASPFSKTSQSFPDSSNKKNTTLLLWVGLGIILLIIGSVGGAFLFSSLNDPLRTLEPFPVGKFLDSPRALQGSTFGGEFRVEANLSYKEGVGRLMLFSTTSDARPIAVMVPEAVGKDIYFTKGQTYRGELEVKEGGLIYANVFRKN